MLAVIPFGIFPLGIPFGKSWQKNLFRKKYTVAKNYTVAKTYTVAKQLQKLHSFKINCLIRKKNKVNKKFKKLSVSCEKSKT